MHGLNPSPPSWFKHVREKLVDPNLIRSTIDEVLESKGTAGKDLNAIYKGLNPLNYMPNIQENFITFIRVAFAVNLHSCILIQKIGRPTLQEDLQISSNFPMEGLARILI